MKYPIVISYHNKTYHSKSYHNIIISMYTLPQKKEFVLKCQENKRYIQQGILRNIILVRVL